LPGVKTSDGDLEEADLEDLEEDLGEDWRARIAGVD
jgi:hypothetical protein